MQINQNLKVTFRRTKHPIDWTFIVPLLTMMILIKVFIEVLSDILPQTIFHELKILNEILLSKTCFEEIMEATDNIILKPLII